ncbi:uncharacterized protein M6B38_119375 [Iris pallida]|uniref:Stress up-regulated Nod 19 n=2 Tax=Iris pallida TaxID=29817 RepID=A0AAX6HAS7_IRIPA|nr:uncharacterized protein M6B38_119375 [Iris pallida]
MWHSRFWVLSLAVLFLTPFVHASRASGRVDGSVKSSVFLSPPFFLQQGSVVNKYYYDIPFPRGHTALKSFDAEVVDEMGASVPLFETYLHHWTVERYYGPKGTQVDRWSPNFILARNAGVCKNDLAQYFGLGSETRRTSTWVPGPYGIEVGNPKEIPSGYEERWVLNVHAIDTRPGVKDRFRCTECKCSLYNVTKSEYGHPLDKDYIGGLYCCYDQTRCQLRDGFKGGEVRKLFLKYTVKWVEWDETIVPVKVYILDVTDPGKTTDRSSCKVEYQVEPCNLEEERNGKCVDTKKTTVAVPHGGEIVYGVAHQHSGGTGAALYGQDGRLLCSSIPTYGKGSEAGNEVGYIVGMSTCYPEPGSVRISDGELLTFESNYSSSQLHTGVMGLFYFLVADPQPLNSSISWGDEVMKRWWAFGLVGVTVAVIFGVGYRRLRRNGEGYQSI